LHSLSKPEIYKKFENPSLVISVDEASKLHRNNNEDIVFIDTRNYWKYAKGHIPGAFNLELYGFHWVDTSRDGISAFAKEMRMLFASLGIKRETQVVFYQNNSGYDAVRGVWLLSFLGHDRTRLLDGGLNLWKRRSLPTSTKDPNPRRMSKFPLKLDFSVLATLDSLSSDLEKRAVQVLDVRTPGEYAGIFRRAQKTGHVPGALNLEWKLALRRDGTLKNENQLLKIYSRLLEKNGEIVTYCQSGYRAAHSWLILKLLGFENVKNYLGSWYEWGNHPEAHAQ
jgi:thiosulfate/3-mercaptopyruvate sulfurtransferase